MECVRVRELCNKLYHPKNLLCRRLMPKWYNDSLAWAESHAKNSVKKVFALRMRYVLNHLCPNLIHLLPKPVFNFYVPEVYDLNSVRYEFENTQARVLGCDGEVISSGVSYTMEEWGFLVCAIFPLVGGETKVSLENYFHSAGITLPLNPSLSSVLQEYTEKFIEVHNLEK